MQRARRMRGDAAANRGDLLKLALAPRVGFRSRHVAARSQSDCEPNDRLMCEDYCVQEIEFLDRIRAGEPRAAQLGLRIRNDLVSSRTWMT